MMVFQWMFILKIFKKNLAYPLGYLHVPPGGHLPPFENHCCREPISQLSDSRPPNLSLSLDDCVYNNNSITI